MNKKNAFTVAKDLPRKMGLLKVFNYINVATVVNNF